MRSLADDKGKIRFLPRENERTRTDGDHDRDIITCWPQAFLRNPDGERSFGPLPLDGQAEGRQPGRRDDTAHAN